MFKPELLKDAEVVKRMTIDEKIAFWRDVMQMAKDRGVDVYWFTWNAFLFTEEGKHGLSRAEARRRNAALFPRQRARDGEDLSAAGRHGHHRRRIHGREARRAEQGGMALADLWRGHSRCA